MIIETEEYFLTTVDNPYNPSTQFESWFAFDSQMKYFSCSKLDRVYTSVLGDDTYDSNSYSEEENYLEAMKRIVSVHPELYKIVKETVYTNQLPYDVDELEKEFEKDPTFSD